MSNFDITILSAISVNLFNRIYLFLFSSSFSFNLFLFFFVCLPRTNRLNLTVEFKKGLFPKTKACPVSAIEFPWWMRRWGR